MQIKLSADIILINFVETEECFIYMNNNDIKNQISAAVMTLKRDLK